MPKRGEIVNRVGQVYLTTEGYNIEIIECFGRFNCTIKFENGHIVHNVQVGQILRGNIKNPFHASVYGIGWYGVGKYICRIGNKNTKCYDAWRGMLRRCYDKKFQEKRPTYKGCTVAEEWHNFQVFAEWYEENWKSYMEGWQLDKDILIKGNKIYSSEACCFVPQEINKLLTKRQNCRGKLPIGIKFNERLHKFEVSLSINGKTRYKGIYLTIEEAFKNYKLAKKEEIISLANRYQEYLAKNCYEALINHKIEITD